MITSPRFQTSSQAFSLVEITLALGIMSFCLLSLLGLLPTGMTSNQTAVEQTAAANIASAIISDIRATSSTSGTSARFGLNIPAAGESDTISGSPYTIYFAEDTTQAASSSVSRYLAYVGFAPPSSGKKSAINVRVLVTWPSQANGATGGWPSNNGHSVETITTLDRN
ncbi:MAG: hypothetical protein ACFUZC_17155 [Chthoniobacteraceae bacterium]